MLSKQEESLLNTILPTLTSHNAHMIGIRSVPSERTFLHRIDDITWSFENVTNNNDIATTPTIVTRVQHVVKKCAQQRIPFKHWLLGSHELRDANGTVFSRNYFYVGTIALSGTGRELWIQFGMWKSPLKQGVVVNTATILDEVGDDEERIFRMALPILSKYRFRHVQVLGIEEILTEPVVLELDGNKWQIGPVPTVNGKKYKIPFEVKDTLTLLKGELAKARTQFDFYMWGDIIKGHVPNDKPRLVSNGSEFYFIKPEEKLPPNVICLFDPILIGIILYRPNRGIWVKIGAWFD